MFDHRDGDHRQGAPGRGSVAIEAVDNATVAGMRQPSDDNLSAAIGCVTSHGSQPVFEAAVVSLDPVIPILLDVVPGGRNKLVEHPGYVGAASVTTSVGITFNASSARLKNRRAASPSRRVDTSTSMPCPC